MEAEEALPPEGATEEEFVSFCASFATLWAKSDDSLSSRERHALVLQLIFDTFDEDNSGFIDAEEFVSLVQVLYGPELHEAGVDSSRIKTREAAYLMLKEYDIDHDGKISFEELEKMLADQHEKVTKIVGGKVSYGLVLRSAAFTTVEKIAQTLSGGLAEDPSQMET
eukprot:Hpha_TRINITY_DN16263_c4_g2::TRINITY_DN16263_c4_g2_i2::g.15639::m.15639